MESQNQTTDVNVPLQQIAKVESFLGGTFLIVLLCFLGFLFIFTLINCVVYGKLSTGEDPKISKGFAAFVLAMNILGLLLIGALFVWIILRFKTIKMNVENGIKSLRNIISKKDQDIQDEAQQINDISMQYRDLMSKFEMLKQQNVSNATRQLLATTQAQAQAAPSSSPEQYQQFLQFQKVMQLSQQFPT